MVERKPTAPTPGPLQVEEFASPSDGRVYFLRINGPKGERIADIYPDASVGGVGLFEARANAGRIVDAWKAGAK